jgi:hypothetical protein
MTLVQNLMLEKEKPGWNLKTSKENILDDERNISAKF